MADDPYADIATPIAPAAQQQGGGDPYADIATPVAPAAAAPPAAPPTPPAKQPTGMGKVTDYIERAAPGGMDWENKVAAGALKSVSGLAGNIVDMVSRPKADALFNFQYKQRNPNATDEDVDQAYKQQYSQTIGGRNAQHLQDAANWLRGGGEPEGFWEHVGSIGEQIGELIGTDGLMKLVGRAAPVAAGISRATETGEKLKQAQQVSQVLAKNPKLAGLVAIGAKASKDAVIQGGQTYLHTEDPTQSAWSGLTAGILGGGAEGLSQTGKYLQGISPTTVNIAGEEIPALRTQVNEFNRPLPTGAAGSKYAQTAQQAAAPTVIRNLAQHVTRSVINQVNATRRALGNVGDIADAIRMQTRALPAPEGAEPFFTLGGTGTAEEATGQIAHEAAPFEPSAMRVPEGGTPSPENVQQLGSTAQTVPERMQKRVQAYTPEIAATGPEPGTGQEGPTNVGPTQTEPGGERVVGGGRLSTNDPQEAQGWLRRLEDIQASPEHSDLTPAQQGAIEAQRKALQDRLGLYYSSPYAPPRFAPVDFEAAAGKVQHFGDAADQIEAAVQPVFQKLDDLSNGQFTALRETAKKARAVMQSPGSMEAYDAAAQRYKDSVGAIDDLITRHGGEISREDYIAAKTAWRQASRLNELHANMERMMSSVTLEQSKRGLPRSMTGNPKALWNFLEKGTNRAQLEDLIGPSGVDNLTDLTNLMKQAKTNRPLIEILKNSALEIGRHARVGGLGGAVGSMLAHSMGIPWYEGMMAGAVTAEGMRFVMRDAMMNPRIGRAVSYATKNNLSPKIYAPLIARMITTPFQEQEQGNEEQQQGGQQ